MTHSVCSAHTAAVIKTVLSIEASGQWIVAGYSSSSVAVAHRQHEVVHVLIKPIVLALVAATAERSAANDIAVAKNSDTCRTVFNQLLCCVSPCFGCWDWLPGGLAYCTVGLMYSTLPLMQRMLLPA